MRARTMMVLALLALAACGGSGGGAPGGGGTAPSVGVGGYVSGSTGFVRMR